MYIYQCSWLHCWLQWVFIKYIYWHSCLISAHKVISMCDMYVAFEGHIFYWHMYGYSMVNKSCSLLGFLTLGVVIWSLYVDTLFKWWDIYVWCCRHICSGAYANSVKCMCISLPGHFVCTKFIWCIYQLT